MASLTSDVIKDGVDVYKSSWISGGIVGGIVGLRETQTSSKFMTHTRGPVSPLSWL